MAQKLMLQFKELHLPEATRHHLSNGQFQVTVFSRFCYILLCNHEYIHCLNHRQAKDYKQDVMKPRENFNLKEGNVCPYTVHNVL